MTEFITELGVLKVINNCDPRRENRIQLENDQWARPLYNLSTGTSFKEAVSAIVPEPDSFVEIVEIKNSETGKSSLFYKNNCVEGF